MCLAFFPTHRVLSQTTDLQAVDKGLVEDVARNETLAPEGGTAGGDDIGAELSLEGEIDLNLRYGGDFSLKEGAVPGAGSSGITDGLKYDFFERVLLQGNIGDRFFVEFNYDSRRTQEGLGEEVNIYSVQYKGKGNEFVREASIGNKYQAIEGSRYITIDQGNPDSFALRGIGGWKNFTVEGLFRYELAFEGKKEFKGYRKNVDMRVLDLDYVKGRYFFLPDTGIDESSLLLYKSTTVDPDVKVDGKGFVLLSRGEQYSFDNTTAYIYLAEPLALDEELVARYTKGGVPVGNPALGINAIIVEDQGAGNGNRSNFSTANNPDYFGESASYLYLRKTAFNSYWELKNIYYLQELEGWSVTDVIIELLLTTGSGSNVNYDSILGNYRIDADRGILVFLFSDATGFYPRPFPGAAPFSPPYSFPPVDPANPFNSTNPIYGGVSYPLSSASIDTIRVQYSYSATSFFLDQNVVPGSVEVKVNGAILDQSFYEVDHALGFLTFDEGVINESSDIVITYKYSPFGSGDKHLLAALGIGYDQGRFRAKNLTSFQTSLQGQEAPDAGTELPRTFQNSTELFYDFGHSEEKAGLMGALRGGVAFSVTNRNAYGSALIAGMEKDESSFELGLSDEMWTIATYSSDLTKAPYNLFLTNRGSVLYKNYWKNTALSGDVLQTLSWAIPPDQVFTYNEKAGPYNTADSPTGGNDESLVIDYAFQAGANDAFVSVVTPLAQENLSSFERFNIVMRGSGITGTDVDVYVELLEIYDEDLNGNRPTVSTPEGEKSINDPGFAITPAPAGSGQTVLGTDREGKSNGELDSEDLNKNNLLDPLTGGENGAVIPRNGSDYIVRIPQGDEGWNYDGSVGIVNLVDQNRKVFQYANALRITVKAVSTSLPAGGSGKLIINKVWFSGSAIVNKSPDYLTAADVSVDENTEVRQNAFSKRYPAIYEELHGTASYRDQNDIVEKVLKVSFETVIPPPAALELPAGIEAVVSRRFGAPADLSFYQWFKMYLFLPTSNPTMPPNLDFVLRFKSSEDENIAHTIDGSSVVPGWNEIAVELNAPYQVGVNGTGVGSMTKTGSLNVLKNVSEVEFGFVATGAAVSGQSVEIWLDEWHVSGSEGVLDTALFAEGTVEYRGTALALRGFPVVEDPGATAGYEMMEGVFYGDPEYRSDRYYTQLNARLVSALNARFGVSMEDVTHIRNREDLPGGLQTDGSYDTFSHELVFDLGKPYVPVLRHSYDRVAESSGVIELTKASYRFKETDTYDDTIEMGESLSLPFGLSQTYSFHRHWRLQNTLTADAPVFSPAAPPPIATLNQINDILLLYGWKSGSVSLGLKRNEIFSGSSTPEYESWPDSYFYKMGRLFAPPGKTLTGAVLSNKMDSLVIDFNRPIGERMGAKFLLSTDHTESNFISAGTERDTITTSRLFLSLPFHPFRVEEIELTPGMERVFKSDYKRVGEGVGENDIVLDTYGYLLLPPLFYISPFDSLGREKDYEAVDLYKGNDDILGTTSNSLLNRYSIDCLLRYDPWYVPTTVGVAFYGETTRQGETYTQIRGIQPYLSKYLPIPPQRDFFDKSLDLAFTYTHEVRYATKIVMGEYAARTALNLLQREFRGVKLIHDLKYERERQKIGEERYFLFPGDPAKDGEVTQIPPKDTVNNALTFAYLWQYRIGNRSLLRRIWRGTSFGEYMDNTDSVTLENFYTWTDKDRVEAFSNVPVRVTLQHLTTYRISDRLEFSANLKTVAGVEEKIVPPSTKGNVLTSMGLEVGIRVKIIF